MAAFGNDCYGGYTAIGRCTSGRTPGCAKGSFEAMPAAGGDLRRMLVSLPLPVGPTIDVGRSRPQYSIAKPSAPEQALWATFLLLGLHRMLGFFVKLIL